MDNPQPSIPPDLISKLRSAHRVTALTGAGISAESGIPTFREAQTGLWARYMPEELATREAFKRNPRLVWEWYQWRRDLIATSAPNPGHYALAQMEAYFPEFTLITQNVDGLHQLAGSGKNAHVLELHGNIQHTKCFDHEHKVNQWEDNKIPPVCPICASPLRPDVVWFGESIPPKTLEKAFKAADTCEIFFSIGTSTIVQPAASLPVIALRSGAVMVEINTHRTPLTPSVHYSLRRPSGEILPQLVQAIWG